MSPARTRFLNPKAHKTLSRILVLTLFTGYYLSTGPIPSSEAVACSPASISVNRISSEIMYVDTGITPQLRGSYVGYGITNSSGSAIADAWVDITNFGGGVVAKAADEDGRLHVGPLAAGQTTHAYFYLVASGSTATPQTHDVAVYSGHPDLGGSQICTSSFTIQSVEETIKAKANKVTTVVAGPNPAELGGEMTITVTGQTGQVGDGPPGHPDGLGVFVATPATDPAWPANAYQLVDTRISFVGLPTYNDTLVVSGLNGSNRDYTAVYTFVAVGTTVAPTSVSPVNYIASGTQIKHTDTSGYAADLDPILPTENKVTLTKAASPTQLPATGGTVTYTITTSNSGTVAATLDDIVDTLPAGGTYVPGTARFNGSLISDPYISGQTLYFFGLFSTPPSGTSSLTYNVALPGTVGSYVNSVTGHIGTEPIDTTLDTSDSAPATATVQVGDPAAPPLANDDTATTPEDTNKIIDVVNNDTDPNSNLDPTSVTITAAPTNGTATPNGDGTVTYDPNDNYNGTDSFTYQVCDTTSPTPLCDTATVNVTVSAVDDPPLAVDDSETTPEDTLATFTLTDNDTDPDGNLVPSSLTIVSGPSHGTITNNNDGTVDYDPTPGYSGADSFTYQVCDSTNPTPLCDTATVSVSVTGVNEPPVANPDTVSTAEDTAVTVDVAANDTDPDGNLDPTSTNITSAPSNGTAVVNPDGSVTYTPAANFNGSDSFEYEICDLDNLCSVASATVTTNVVPVDDPPEATNDNVSTNEDTAATFNLTSNDSDPDGNLDPTSVDVLSGPANGTAVVNPDGTVTYTPTTDYEGGDSLTYEVCDSTNPTPLCDTATVTITVNAVDDSPVAVDDSTSTPEDTPVTVNVAANDTDPDGNLNPTSVTIVTPPAMGGAAVNLDGTITYTPALNDSGVYTITYQICDNTLPTALCDQADLVVTVNNTPDPPNAVDDPALTTPEDTDAIFDLTGNDTDPDNDLVDSSLTILSGPSHGTVTDNNDGTITYDPDPNWNGTDTVVYQVCDATAPTPLCDSATATISVTAVDDPPVANNDSAATGEDGDVVIDVAANDTDPDNDLDLTSVTFTVDPTNGTVTSNNDGTVTYSPNDNYFGTDSFTYQICDGTPTCDTATVSVSVTEVNDLPDAVDDTVSVDEDDSATWDLAANDSDVDGDLDDTSLTILSGPSNGSIVNLGDGRVTYTPVANYHGSDSLTYEICDDHGECATATVTITVNPMPDPPVAANDAATTPEDTAITVNVSSNDSDIDGDLDPTDVSIVTGPTAGTASVNPAGTITYTPADDDAGTYTITYQICDDTVPTPLCDTADLVVTVTAVDDPPSASDDTLTVMEDTPGTVNVSTNDSDVDGDLDPTTVTITGQGSDGTAVSNGDGTVTYTPDGDYNGSDSFTYQICDGTGLCDSATVAVTVDPAADSPVAVDDSSTIDEDASVTVDVAFNDTDPDGDVDPTSVSIAGGPANGTATANGDGTITYTPTAEWNGTDTITYEVCDLTAPTPLCDTGTLTVTVDPLPDPPTVVGDLASMSEDGSVIIDVTNNDSDPDGDLDPTSVAVGTPPSHGGVSVDPVTGDITYVPVGDWNGTDSFTYQVCDLGGTCDTATVTVVVSPVNDAPTPQPDSTLIWEDTPVTIDVIANDTDIDNAIDPTSVRVIESALHGVTTVDPVTGEITYTPDPDYHGPDTFSYLVCDQSAACGITSVAVTIMPVNDEPVRVDAVTFELTVGDTPGDTQHEDPEGDAFTVMLVSGLLPPGIELLPDGTFVGTAAVAGTYVATIEVCDIHGACSQSPLVIQVGSAFVSLPFTGFGFGGLSLLGLLLMAVGSVTRKLAREDR